MADEKKGDSMKAILYLLPAFLLVLIVPSTLNSQSAGDSQSADLGARVVELESSLSKLRADTQEHGEEISRLDSVLDRAEEAGVITYFFGVFCALWAQNTKRNSLIWFFAGVFFSLFTVLLLLVKNSEDIRRRQIPDSPLGIHTSK